MKFALKKIGSSFFSFFAKQSVIKVKIKGIIEDLNFFFKLKNNKKERKKE